MTTTDQTEFERIAALTIKANEAVAHELENGGDSHTCVVATMGVFQPEIDKLKADLDQARRGAQELGKSVVFLGELIKDAYVRGADDPIDALHMLGNVLGELFEDEGGLSADEFNRVQQAMSDRRAEANRNADIKARMKRYAKLLNDNPGMVPAGDVAWMLRSFLNGTPTPGVRSEASAEPTT